MEKLFYPKSIAIIGASRNEHKIGTIILKSIIKKFKGEIYPINPKADQILGLKVYPSLKEIGKKVDVAVISVKNEIVPEIIEEIDQLAHFAVIITGGFDEIGRYDLKEKIIKNRKNIRIVGPNCVGIYNYLSGIDTLFMPDEKMEKPKNSGIVLISQSGAIGTAILDKAADKNIPFGTLVSFGNGYDLNENDFLEYFGLCDDHIKVICLYLEGFKDGEKFYEIAKKVKKPIILLKGGRTNKSKEATKSHTASMAGNFNVLKGVSKQMNIHIVEDMDEMLDLAKSYYFLGDKVKKGMKSIGVITNGGGFGVLSVDEIYENGLKLAKFNFNEIDSLPKEIKIHNPFDLWGDADYVRYDLSLRKLCEDPDVDIILCNILFQTGPLDDKIIEVLKKHKDKKPLFVMSYGGKYTSKRIEEIENIGIPCFETVKEAIKTIKKMVDL